MRLETRDGGHVALRPGTLLRRQLPQDTVRVGRLPQRQVDCVGGDTCPLLLDEESDVTRQQTQVQRAFAMTDVLGEEAG